MNHSAPRTIRFALARTCLVALSMIFIHTPLYADHDDTDFGSMSLDELLEMEISRREPMGIHHTHKKGEFMFSISHMHMSMSGNRDGSNELSTAEVHADFTVAPTDMNTDMLMLGAMYAPSDSLTFMVMLPYLDKSMDLVTRMDIEFSTRAKGLGDLSVSALKTVWHDDNAKLHIELGFNAPTGSIDRKDDTPVGYMRLPYPMQLGSGTWDLKLGATYQAIHDKLSYGLSATGIFRTGENDNDYRLGHQQSITGFVSYLINDSFSAHVRLDGYHMSDISGADPQLNPMMVPTARPDLSGGNRLTSGVGINFFAETGFFADQRFSMELTAPIVQNLHGPQMGSDWMLRTSWSWVH